MTQATDWFEEDAAICDFCLGPSSMVHAVLCFECDRAACAFCMVRVIAAQGGGGPRALYCPACASEASVSELPPVELTL